MTVNRTTLLDLPLPVTGTESGTWGDTTNNGLTQYMDIAIAGMSNLTSANFTAGALTIETTEGDSSATNISATSAQYAGFRVSSLAVNSTITVGNTGTSPARSYRLINADATYNLTFKATGQTGVTLLPGQSAVVAFNGTDYVIVGTVGAGTATDNAVARFDGTTGEILQNSAATIDDTGAATFVGSVNVSGTSASAADLKLYEDTDNGTNYVAFKSPASVASNVTWTLPSADGTNGQALTTNGSGTLAFSSVTTAPGGSTTQVQYNNAGAFGGSANFVFDGTNVGIGASSPADRLDVRQAGVAARFTSTNGNANQIALSNSATAVVGFYMGSPAANVLQFSDSTGTERLRIDSAGNVGIGTSSPLARLTVSDSTATNGTMTLGNNASYNGTLQYIFSTGELRISQVGGASLGTTFYTAGSERMRITSGGVVMVGATSAHGSEKVLINGGGTSPTGDGYLTLRRGSDASSGAGIGVIDFADTRTSSIYARIQAIADATPGTNDFPGALVFYTTADGASSTTERMRIDSSGKVGIGTSSPNDVLTVGGSNAFIRVDRDGNEPGIEFRVSSSTTNRGKICVTTSGDMYFTSGGATERMRIDSAGNLGLGVTPSAWASSFNAFQLGNGSSRAASLFTNGVNDFWQTSNAFFNGSNWVYYATGATTAHNQVDGSFIWSNAASGTAGNTFSFTERMRLTSAGELYIAGNSDQGAYNLQCFGTGVWGAGAYVNGSDERIKDDITPINSSLNVVEKFNPVTYRYKKDWSKDQSVQTGFIAQELLVALEGKNYVEGVVKQGSAEGYYSVAYQNLIPILTKAIQELKAIVDVQAARISALEAAQQNQIGVQP